MKGGYFLSQDVINQNLQQGRYMMESEYRCLLTKLPITKTCYWRWTTRRSTPEGTMTAQCGPSNSHSEKAKGALGSEADAALSIPSLGHLSPAAQLLSLPPANSADVKRREHSTSNNTEQKKWLYWACSQNECISCQRLSGRTQAFIGSAMHQIRHRLCVLTMATHSIVLALSNG